jgi:hypothetical protein
MALTNEDLDTLGTKVTVVRRQAHLHLVERADLERDASAAASDRREFLNAKVKRLLAEASRVYSPVLDAIEEVSRENLLARQSSGGRSDAEGIGKAVLHARRL